MDDRTIDTTANMDIPITIRFTEPLTFTIKKVVSLRLRKRDRTALLNHQSERDNGEAQQHSVYAERQPDKGSEKYQRRQ